MLLPSGWLVVGGYPSEVALLGALGSPGERNLRRVDKLRHAGGLAGGARSGVLRYVRQRAGSRGVALPSGYE